MNLHDAIFLGGLKIGDKMRITRNSFADATFTLYKLVDESVCKVPTETDDLVRVTLAFCHSLSCLEGNSRHW